MDDPVREANLEKYRLWNEKWDREHQDPNENIATIAKKIQTRTYVCNYCTQHSFSSQSSRQSHYGNCAAYKSTISGTRSRIAIASSNEIKRKSEIDNQQGPTKKSVNLDNEDSVSDDVIMESNEGGIDDMLDCHVEDSAPYVNYEDTQAAVLNENDLSKPSEIVFLFQMKMQKEYVDDAGNNIPPFKVRNRGNMRNCTWQDYVDLVHIQNHCNLSFANGDILLSILNRILERHDLNGHLCLPNQWQTLHDSVNSSSSEFCSVVAMTIPFDPDLFGTLDTVDKPLKQCTFVYFHLHERLAEVLLMCDPSTFQGTPTSPQMRQGMTVNNSIQTGAYFMEQYKLLISEKGTHNEKGEKTTNGTHNSLNQELYLICAVVSEDEAAINSTRSKSMEPMVVEFSCFNSATGNIELLGFSPLKWPEPIAFYDDLLKCKQKCYSKIQRKLILASEKRRHKYVYIEQVLKSFLEKTSENGFVAQIGLRSEGKSTPKIACMYLKISCLSGDNKSLDSWNNVKSHAKGCNCRCCTEVNPLRFTALSARWKYRNHYDMKALAFITGDIEKRLFIANYGRKKKMALTTEDQAMLSLGEKFNIIPGMNPWYNLLCYGPKKRTILLSDSETYVSSNSSVAVGVLGDEELRALIDRLSGFDIPNVYNVSTDYKMLLRDLQAGGGGTNRCLNSEGLHLQSPADELHTILKGPIQDAITWIMAVLYHLQVINSELYGDIVHKINHVLKHFPRKQTFIPFGPIPGLSSGISYWFPEHRATKKGNTSGMACSLSASRLPGILFMLLIAIGQRNNIVPGFVILPINSKKYLRDQDNWDVAKVCTNALQSCYDVLVYSTKSDGFINPEYVILNEKVAMMRAHLIRLFDLRTDLLRCKKGLPVVNDPRPSFRGRKQHLLEHLAFWIHLLGPTKNFDTQRSEKYHMRVKELYEFSSKNTESVSKEMAKRLALQFRIALLSERSMREDTSKKLKSIHDKIVLSNVPDKVTYGFLFSYVSNASYDSLTYNRILHGGSYLVNVTTAGYVRRSEKQKTPANELNSQFMHPFLSMTTLSTILASATPESFFRALDKFNQNVDPRTDIHLELLSQIKCNGDEALKVKPFQVTCNARVPNNRKDCVENQSTISVFSHLLVNYGIDPVTKQDQNDTVVKVMAIVHLGKRYINSEGKQQLGRIILIVAGMQRSTPGPESSLPYEKLSYLFNKNDLDLGVISPSMIRLPVCVVPEFSKVQVPEYEETFADRTNYTKARPEYKIKALPPRAASFRFLLVPNYNPLYDNAHIKVISDSILADAANINNRGNVNSLILDNEALNVVNLDIMDLNKLSIRTDLDSEIHSVASDHFDDDLEVDSDVDSFEDDMI